jgi:hypothetical protein
MEIFSLPDIYDWSWTWSKVEYVTSTPIIDLAQSTTDNISVTALPVNGEATLVVKAKIDTDVINHTEKKEYFGYAKITTNLCANPWPADGQPWTDTNSYANFSLFYCRDTDDLPALKLPPAIVHATSSVSSLRDYLFQRDDESTDAIGIKIFPNLKHLSPTDWYADQNFPQGSPQTLNVDGYEAIRDGSSVYVSAAAVSPEQIYTNIYVISYNEFALDKTTAIFDQLIKNWHFNINVDDLRICPDNQTYCDKDEDCSASGLCNANKTKLIRDTKRITDLGNLKQYLIDYKQINSYYPKLGAGSFIGGQSTSKWPSWTQTLTSDLGRTLPTDPLNSFKLPCSGDATENLKYEEISCWNDTDKNFFCPLGSHLYLYQTDNGTNFKIYANMEYENKIWSGMNATWKKDNSCQDFMITQ